jgi:hypothetical protein
MKKFSIRLDLVNAIFAGASVVLGFTSKDFVWFFVAAVNISMLLQGVVCGKAVKYYRDLYEEEKRKKVR